MAKKLEKRKKLLANDLSGGEWTKYSISVWNDIRKSAEELKLKHPALFPEMLIDRILKVFTRSDQKVVLDPFMGSGSTAIAAYKAGKQGIGFEVNYDFIKIAKQRLDQLSLEFSEEEKYEPLFFNEDARELDKFLFKDVDICITSPPYWDILEQKRTADGKEKRNYGAEFKDLAKIQDYEEFLCQLDIVWAKIYEALKPESYMIVNVMDLRKKSVFFPYHMDISRHICDIGKKPFILDDLIIWDRRQEYNNLRPLGYPYRFRINKIHEFLMIFQKPA